MGRLLREPESLAGKSFDLVIVGGGIYGAMLLLEATRAGMSALLLERDDFGAATSSSHFRIGHGGLRYLQSFDLRRFRRSVRERRWLIRMFPALVTPLRCVMPLYGQGVRRTAVMRPASWLNNILAIDRNWGVSGECQLSGARVAGPRETNTLFPVIPSKGLQGALVWEDAALEHENRVLMEALLWASEHGGRAQNYMEVTDVKVENGEVVGVAANDREAGDDYIYPCRAVVNAAGPWAREFARSVDRDYPELFRRSRAWNVVFDRDAIGEGALAAQKPGSNGRTLFFRSLHEQLYVGTGHAACDPEEEDPRPSDQQLSEFIRDLNRSLPGLGLSLDEVARIDAGFLPAGQEFSANTMEEPTWIDHGERHGPAGFFSLSGVKYTTARHVAEQAVSCVQQRIDHDAPKRFSYDEPRQVHSDYQVASANSDWRASCKRIVEHEAVRHLDDLILRRTDLGDYPIRLEQLLPQVLNLFDWPDDRRRNERGRLERQMSNH